MVRDTVETSALGSQKQPDAAETKSQNRGPEEEPRAQHPQRLHPVSQEAADTEQRFLFWSEESPEEEPEPKEQLEPGAGGLPTHFRPFRSPAEYKLVKQTYLQLQQSGFYWGPMSMEEAHEKLSEMPPGTFLVRDSGQQDIFFTLSYQSEDGPTSVRVQLSNLLFSLHGSQKTFPSLFHLLGFYSGSCCKLTAPLRRQRPERLKQLCRRALIRTHGAQGVRTLPGLSSHDRNFLHAYPHSI